MISAVTVEIYLNALRSSDFLQKNETTPVFLLNPYSNQIIPMLAGGSRVYIFILIMKIRHMLFVRVGMTVIMQNISVIAMWKNIGIHPVVTGIKRTC